MKRLRTSGSDSTRATFRYLIARSQYPRALAQARSSSRARDRFFRQWFGPFARRTIKRPMFLSSLAQQQVCELKGSLPPCAGEPIPSPCGDRARLQDRHNGRAPSRWRPGSKSFRSSRQRCRAAAGSGAAALDHPLTTGRVMYEMPMVVARKEWQFEPIPCVVFSAPTKSPRQKALIVKVQAAAL